MLIMVAEDEALIELHHVPAERLAGLRGLFTDIDDTLSTDGKLTAEAYGALWRLREAGLRLAVVTGRPAGWCDHIARFWPVDAVISENGGLYFYHDGHKLRRRAMHDAATRAEFRRRLDGLRERILAAVPGCAVASDQPYREYDLAIDYCEDVPALPREAALTIKRLFEEAGAHAKISSIHVNGWFGEFDKLSTARLMARELFDIDLDAERGSFAFCGDSPNDEPMFAYFALSFGMANIRPFLEMMKHGPAIVTSRPAGAGFQEVAERIIAARSRRSELNIE